MVSATVLPAGQAINRLIPLLLGKKGFTFCKPADAGSYAEKMRG